jgi:hypothetical protein
LFSSRRNHAVGHRKEEYATPCDLGRIFHARVDELYTLALLLTADQNKAEQCFVAGLEDCLKGNVVFREWAQSWARRVVIKNAIKMVSPEPGETQLAVVPNKCEPRAFVSRRPTLVDAIMELGAFERFVYVISVLERYSVRDCSTLLRCTVAEIADARIRALQQLAGVFQKSAG